jgi:N6-L-threonylcarbamoyladenine synthase
MTATSIAEALHIPVIPCSHQEGHIAAAAYGSGHTELLTERFIAFHVSGGTTELLLCEGDKITLVGGTEDLTAGQAIDRIGVKMGLSFPCGAALEKLATGREATAGKISVKGLSCNLSGLENRAEKMLSEGATKEEVAAFTIEFVRKTLQKLTENAFEVYGKLPVLYAGGVMSCQIIKKDFEKRFGGYFAQPAFSADNACGVALLAEEAHHKGAEVAE